MLHFSKHAAFPPALFFSSFVYIYTDTRVVEAGIQETHTHIVEAWLSETHFHCVRTQMDCIYSGFPPRLSAILLWC